MPGLNGGGAMNGLNGSAAHFNTPLATNEIIPFQLDDADIRGRFIQADALVTEILNKHDYPPVISELLGEAVVMTALIGSGLKLNGKMTLQVQSDGAVNLLAADYRADGGTRGYADYDPEKLERWTGGEALNPFLLLGSGHIIITVDNGDSHPYQSVSPIEGRSLSAVLLKYMERSEQILSSLRLCVRQADRAEGGSPLWRAGAILLQKLGKSGADQRTVPIDDTEEEDWNRAGLLFKTLTDEELIDPSVNGVSLLYRLFHEEGLRVFDSQNVHFFCGCERERFLAFLKTLPKEELESLAQENGENGKIVTNCRFCSEKRLFSLEELV